MRLPIAPRRGPFRAAFALMLLGASCAATPQIVLRAQLIVAGGGRSQSPGGCRAISGSLGEPAGGRASGGAFVVVAGFWAGAGSPDPDLLFNTGFEECS